MARPRRRRLERDERRSDTIPQLPWQEVTNPFPPAELLTPEQLTAIHDTSLRILEELGIELMSAPARQALRNKGADVNESTGLVRMERGLVESLIATAPPSVTLTPRDPPHKITIGDRHLVFNPSGRAAQCS